VVPGKNLDGLNGVVDYLGLNGFRVPVMLKPESVFVILPAGEASKLKLEPPFAVKPRLSTVFLLR